MERRQIDRYEVEEIAKLSQALGYSRAQVTRLLIRLGLREYRKTGLLRCGHYPCGRAECCGGALHPGAIIRGTDGTLGLLPPKEAERRRASFKIVAERSES